MTKIINPLNARRAGLAESRLVAEGQTLTKKDMMEIFLEFSFIIGSNGDNRIGSEGALVHKQTLLKNLREETMKKYFP